MPKMMSQRAASAFAALLLAAGADAYANDTFARKAAGGLMFVKTDQVRMLQEDLEISTEQVKVRYKFRNEGTVDLVTTIAFPIPSFDPIAATVGGDSFITNFKVFVDGSSVNTEREDKAVIREIDVTAQLRKIGLTDEQIFGPMDSCSHEPVSSGCGHTGAQVRAIRALDPKGKYPPWNISTTHHWQQRFPAGRTIEVQHEYRPMVGSIYAGALDREKPGNILRPEEKEQGAKDACVDEAFQQALLRKARAMGEGKPGLSFTAHRQDVEYILGTGRNWKGSIEQFTLTINKGSPDVFVSVCFPGKPKRLDSKTIEFRQQKYMPQDRLVVYFYSVAPWYKARKKDLLALTPPGVQIAFIARLRKDGRGARIIALAKSQEEIDVYMRRLKATGSPHVDQTRLEQVEVCGQNWMRADFDVGSGDSDLPYEDAIPDLAEIHVPVDGQETQCKVRLR